MTSRSGARVLALAGLLVAGLLVAVWPAAPTGAAPAARPVSGPTAAAPAPTPPRNDADKADLLKPVEVLVRTKVDSDRDGERDVVRVVFTRPRPALVKGRRLAVVGHASPYWACCSSAANHDVDVPLGGPRAAITDGFLTDVRGEALSWARRGYAFARIASLGSSRSTGCPTVGDPAEAAGVVAFVDWLNGRAVGHTPGGKRVRPAWATGKVGLTGASYDGTLPNMAAATGVEGLEAIVPVSAISSWYDYYRQDGLVVAPGGYQGEDADVLARFDYTRRDREICEPVLADLGRDQDRATGDYNDFWAARDLLPHADDVHAATLIAHGFGDTNVKPLQASQWYQALREAGVPTKIWWDQNGHGTPIPQRIVLKWFDRFLYGVDNGIDRGPRAWVDGERQADWPRPGSTDLRYTLQAGGTEADGVGTLRRGGTGSATTQTLTDDPSLSAGDVCARARPGAALGYRTAPVGGLELSGLPVARLRVASSAPATNLTVALCQHPPGGTRVVSQGWLDPQNRESLTDGTALTPGTFYDLTVRMQPLDRRLPGRSELTFVVMASDHDYTLRPPGPGVRLTLDLAASELSLPVVRP